MREYIGKINGNNVRIGIVVSRFNEMITKNLLSGAFDALHRHGVEKENITIAWVPGAFEIPVVAKQMAESQRYDAILCLGAIIRGATPHFDYVASQSASGVAHIALDTGIPVIFGILTTDTIEQAIERSGTKAGNKGAETAVAAIEMADLMKQLSSERPLHHTVDSFQLS